jgi:hypothetical protein
MPRRFCSVSMTNVFVKAGGPGIGRHSVLQNLENVSSLFFFEIVSWCWITFLHRRCLISCDYNFQGILPCTHIP